MSAYEKNLEKFAAACEDGLLCDPQYCPYMRGETSRLGACEGDYCEEAWERYCEQAGEEDENDVLQP